MNCPRCGNAVAENARECPHCSAAIKPLTLWQKLLAWLSRSAKQHPIKITQTVTVKSMNIVTNADGERHVYHSLDETPPELRAKIESALAQARQNESSKTFTIRDASGQERTYHSLEDMPPEIRTIVERPDSN